MTAAFADDAWQRRMRLQLDAESERLTSLLRTQGLAPHSTPLFAWTDDARAPALHEALARRGVWTRLFTSSCSVRFGLPGNEAEWARFEQSLIEAIREIAAA